MQSYAPYQRESTVRARGRALDGALPNASQPNAALHAFVAALDVTNEAALIVDRSGTIVHANAACESLLGCNDLIGRRLPSLYPLAGRGLRKILRELQTHGVWRANVPVQCAGARVEVSVALSSVPIAPLSTTHSSQHASPGRAGHASHTGQTGHPGYVVRPRYFCLV